MNVIAIDDEPLNLALLALRVWRQRLDGTANAPAGSQRLEGA